MTTYEEDCALYRAEAPKSVSIRDFLANFHSEDEVYLNITNENGYYTVKEAIAQFGHLYVYRAWIDDGCLHLEA